MYRNSQAKILEKELFGAAKVKQLNQNTKAKKIPP
jgi:hypothetical protein